MAEYAPVDSTSTYSGEMKQFDVENANIVNIGTFTSNVTVSYRFISFYFELSHDRILTATI